MARHPRPHLPSLGAGVVLGLVLGFGVSIPGLGLAPATQTVVEPQAFNQVTLGPEREPWTLVTRTPIPMDHPEEPRVQEPTPQPTPTPTPKPTPKPTTAVYRPSRTFNSSVSDARAYAKSSVGTSQFSCLDILWDRESGWRTAAENRSSGAYGIPQALPGSKMASAGDDWRTNPVTQVKWGLRYIEGRYGSACNALQHFYNVGWY